MTNLSNKERYTFFYETDNIRLLGELIFLTLNFYFIGHFAIDTVIKFNEKNKPTLGGSVSYCSLSLQKYTNDVEISIISKFNQEKYNNKILEKIKKQDINLSGVKLINEQLTNFVLDYYNHSRTLKLQSRCPDLEFNDIPEEFIEKKPDVIVLVPLCNEIAMKYLSNIVKKFPNTYIGIDLQGFIRLIDNDGKVLLIYDKENIENLYKIIELIGDKLILKGSEQEMKILSGKKDWTEIMEHFKQFNGLYIMTLNSSGSMISKRGEKIIKIPAFKPKKVSDETGAGDVYFAVFLYEFLKGEKTWENIKEAGYLASAAASFEIEKKGVNGFRSKSRVKKRVSKENYINLN
ncbi:MAG: hypothetical protein GF317_12955 [Candidatus Lokiarchaeota archaeon]|nr:hypothetical protein [Candidatus Lokiarchaeota archaeon]MBD3200550.1 hypothetical protein [Candidatus Lokiarchaeota archaeon]